jgi:hypothetical protein
VSNCIGKACPTCRGDDAIVIDLEATVVGHVHEQWIEYVITGSIYSGDSHARCRSCGWCGTIADMPDAEEGGENERNGN